MNHQQHLLLGIGLEICYFIIMTYMDFNAMLIFSKPIIILGLISLVYEHDIIIVIFTFISIIDNFVYMYCLYHFMQEYGNVKIITIFTILIVSLKLVKITAALEILENKKDIKKI